MSNEFIGHKGHYIRSSLWQQAIIHGQMLIMVTPNMEELFLLQMVHVHVKDSFIRVECSNITEYGSHSLVLRPCPAFRRLQFFSACGRAWERGYGSHASPTCQSLHISCYEHCSQNFRGTFFSASCRNSSFTIVIGPMDNGHDPWGGGGGGGGLCPLNETLHAHKSFLPVGVSIPLQSNLRRFQHRSEMFFEDSYPSHTCIGNSIIPRSPTKG